MSSGLLDKTFDDYFYEPDFIIRTSDGHDFAITKRSIVGASGILARDEQFASMTSPHPDQPIVYNVSDSHSVWWVIIWHLCHIEESPDDLFFALQTVYQAWLVATQLEMTTIAERIWTIVDRLTKNKPFSAFHTFYLAGEEHREKHCKLAAQYILQNPADPENGNAFTPEEKNLLETYKLESQQPVPKRQPRTTRGNRAH